MKTRQTITEMEITDISTEGKGIGRNGSMVCFIEYAVPGDLVDIEVTKKKSSYLEGRVIEYRERSSERTEPPCPHFGICGGCKWQNLRYETQLFFKQKFVSDALTRIGKIEAPVLPILPSPNIYAYRNKLEFTFTNKRWLTRQELDLVLKKDGKDYGLEHNAIGFHIPGMFDKVMDIEHCSLQAEPSNSIRQEVKEYARKHRMTFFDIRKQEGWLRTLILRNNGEGQWMVILVFLYEDRELREQLLTHLADTFPAIVSLQYVINPKANDSISDLEVHRFSGESFLEEKMEDLRFRISPKAFFQTNTPQAGNLYRTTREFAGLTGTETVYDLYTGTGTIANFVARQARKVIGVEYLKEAIEDARINSEYNGIKNTLFFSGDIKQVMDQKLFHQHGKPDVIITDPPRAGMHEDVVKTILLAGPEKIIYVSCNPATQARDLAMMSEHYRVEKVQPVDMFPHTAHVESVAKLVRV